MTETDTQAITDAAATVFGALQPLDGDQRARVLHAAAALFGIRVETGEKQRRESKKEEESGEDNDASADPEGSKRQSLVELLNAREPATNSQRLACFAYYREHVEKKGSRFSRADLEPYFASAKLAKPGNYKRDFVTAVQAGWIHEDGANSYLTQGGENAVRAGFGGKGKPRGASGTRKKKKLAREQPE